MRIPADALARAAYPLATLLLAVGVLYLGFAVDRTRFGAVSGMFTLAFAGYFWLVGQRRGGLRGLIALGIGLRVALVFAFPQLSDDLYRFLWDGHLIVAGQNPFAHLPAHYLEAGNAVPGLTPELFGRLNSPGYHTIYPPVAQASFTLAVWLFPHSWYGAAVVIKLILLACELGTLVLLYRLLGARTQVQGKAAGAGVVRSPAGDRWPLVYYWLNPLVIVEITGNLHFEGAMVFFLLLAYALLQGGRLVGGAAAMAAAVASKLLPLMLLPFLIRRLVRGPLFWRRTAAAWWRDGRDFVVFSLAFGGCCLLFFLPFLLSPDFIAGFRSSLALYQQKFEFNGSLYYLARAVGTWYQGWNPIATVGPALARVAAGGILLLALMDRRRDWRSLPAGWLWAFVLYLLCATTVHPWYLAVPLVLCGFTHWRFPLVWSYLITLTYVSYATVPYAENLWLVGLEYGLTLAFLAWEVHRRGVRPSPTGF